MLLKVGSWLVDASRLRRCCSFFFDCLWLRFLIKTASQGAMEPTKGKFEVEKFDGQGDFGIWKHKMLCT